MNQDRNFDDLAERFQRKVYGGLKGAIRLAVLARDLEPMETGHPGRVLKVLDVGAGFAQLSIGLAKRGHRVCINDISARMLEVARAQAQREGVEDLIEWRQAPYQSLERGSDGRFDLILCHAVIEWLAEPARLIPALRRLLSDRGVLSLTFYNQHALIYRNLIRGNFRMLNKDRFEADPKSLTPGNPLHPDQVREWLDESGLQVVSTSGIRLFHDYVTSPRGGNEVPEAVLEMELNYSRSEPYLWLGRYIHHLCRITSPLPE